jgi:hypothetical protein
MREPEDPVFGHSTAILSLTWRGGFGEHRAHCPFRVPCVLRPALWMDQETGLT